MPSSAPSGKSKRGFRTFIPPSEILAGRDGGGQSTPSGKGDLLFYDPWAKEWVTTREEIAWRCLDVYAVEARTWRYRLRRLWKGVTTHVWMPDAGYFERWAVGVLRRGF